MASFSGVIRSEVLRMDTAINVILPYDRPAEKQHDPCKVVYLLHGLGDNCAAWARYTAIEVYARAKGIAVIMPEVQRSFYTDMAFGPRYFSYITEELPKLCGKMFHIGRRREDSYIAGLSMGGYGALKCAFTYPEQYAGCASFSGAVDIIKVMEEHGSDDLGDEFRGILGMDLSVPQPSDLLHLAKNVASLPKAQRPHLFLTCGTNDFLYDVNLSFRDYLQSLGLTFTFLDWEGDHTWPFWDKSIQMLLDLWFPTA